MKITCPECSASFDVPPSLLGDGGRRVRCGTCGHVWMQPPSVAPAPGSFGGFRAMEMDGDIEPIPASVHPRDLDDDDDGDEGPGFFADIKWGALARMVLGFALALALAAGAVWGLAASGMLPAVLKPVAGVMGLAAASHESPLRIEGVTARVSGGMTVVTGKVVNPQDRDQPVPVLEIIPIDSNGMEGEGKRITLSEETLKAGENMSFGAELQGMLEDGGTLRLRFVD